jgi:hypothetical protein
MASIEAAPHKSATFGGGHKSSGVIKFKETTPSNVGCPVRAW